MATGFKKQPATRLVLRRIGPQLMRAMVLSLCLLFLATETPSPANAGTPDETIEFFYWDVPNDSDLFGLGTGFIYTDKHGMQHYMYGFSDEAHQWPLDFFERNDPKFRLGKLVMLVRSEPPEPVVGTKVLKRGPNLVADFEKLKAVGAGMVARQNSFAYIPNPANALPVKLSDYKVIERNGQRVIVPKKPTERIDLVLWDVPDDDDNFGKTSAIRYTDRSGRRTYIYGISSLGNDWPENFLTAGKPDYVHGTLVAKVTKEPPVSYFTHMGVVATGSDLSGKFNAMVALARRIETLKPVFAYLPSGKQANGNALSNGVMVNTGHAWPEIKSLFYE